MTESTPAPKVRVGVDVANQVIQVHAVDALGRPAVARVIKRDQLVRSSVPAERAAAIQGIGALTASAGVYFRRVWSLLDKPKAVTAAAHKLARLIYTMLTKNQEYYEECFRERVLRALSQRAAKLGMQMVPAIAARLPQGRTSLDTWGSPCGRGNRAAEAWRPGHEADDGSWLPRGQGALA